MDLLKDIMTFINLETIKTEHKTGFAIVGGQCE
jgi:hypothetical protein